MPEVVRKPVEPVKGGEGTPTTSTSTSATPATSAAPSPAPPTATATSTDDGKDKEVCEIKVLLFFIHNINNVIVFTLSSFYFNKILNLYGSMY